MFLRAFGVKPQFSPDKGEWCGLPASLTQNEEGVCQNLSRVRLSKVQLHRDHMFDHFSASISHAAELWDYCARRDLRWEDQPIQEP